MRVLHVTPSFYPARHCVTSGFGLCSALAKIPQVEVRVLTTDSDGPKGRKIEATDFPTRFSEGFEVYYCRRVFGKDVSPSMWLRLWSMIRWADVVHLVAVYSAPTIPTLLLCKLMRKPVVWSPRGALQRWSGSTHKTTKQLWEHICNGLCDADRVLLHTTSEEERNESLPRISRATPIMVPNGIDIPRSPGTRQATQAKPARLLYLGRLHPIKGIENLLMALAQTDSDIQLSICGDGTIAYRDSLERLSRDLDLKKRVTFYGTVEGAEKERHFHSCDICVVPSYKEAFCLVVAESLSRGIPVIVSTGTPWKSVTSVGCGLSVDNDPESLAKAITTLLTMPLNEMGELGREWMKRDYSWAVIAQKIAAHYGEMVKVRDEMMHTEQSRQPTR